MSGGAGVNEVATVEFHSVTMRIFETQDGRRWMPMRDLSKAVMQQTGEVSREGFESVEWLGYFRG
jgi:hypothetical protein